MARSRRTSRYAIYFLIEGRKTQGVGYRTHLAMLALTSGVERLYAENQPKEKRGRTERVMVYAGADRSADLKRFYESVRTNVPEGARDVRLSPSKPYRSRLLLPTVSEYVSTLTAGELGKGIDVIAGLDKEARLGFVHLGAALTTLDANLKTQLEGLPPKIGKSVVSALVESGFLPDSKKDHL